MCGGKTSLEDNISYAEEVVGLVLTNFRLSKEINGRAQKKVYSVYLGASGHSNFLRTLLEIQRKMHHEGFACLAFVSSLLKIDLRFC